MNPPFIAGPNSRFPPSQLSEGGLKRPGAMMAPILQPLDKRIRGVNASTIPLSPQAALYNEMLLVLTQLYDGMNVTDRMTLDQLKVTDFALYERIRIKAEENISRGISNPAFLGHPSPVVAPAHRSGNNIANPFLSSNNSLSHPPQYQDHRQQYGPSNDLLDTTTRSAYNPQQPRQQFQQNDQITDTFLMRGFIDRVLVNVDTSRFKALMTRINDYISFSGVYADPPRPANRLTQASMGATHRLHALFDTLVAAASSSSTNPTASKPDQRMPLPSILFHGAFRTCVFFLLNFQF